MFDCIIPHQNQCEKWEGWMKNAKFCRCYTLSFNPIDHQLCYVRTQNKSNLSENATHLVVIIGYWRLWYLAFGKLNTTDISSKSVGCISNDSGSRAQYHWPVKFNPFSSKDANLDHFLVNRLFVKFSFCFTLLFFYFLKFFVCPSKKRPARIWTESKVILLFLLLKQSCRKRHASIFNRKMISQPQIRKNSVAKTNWIRHTTTLNQTASGTDSL